MTTLTAATDRRPALDSAVRWIDDHSSVIIAASAIVAIGLSLAVVVRTGDGGRFLDEEHYVTLASNVAHHFSYSLDGATASTFRPPGLPLLLAPVAAISDDLVVFRAFNALLMGAVVALGAVVARLIAGRTAGALTALVIALSPLQFYTASKAYPQTLASVLLLAAIAALLMSRDRPTKQVLGWTAVAGLALGLLTLTVPNHGVTALVAALWLLYRLRRQAVPAVLVLVVACTLPVAAWTARNVVSTGDFVPISTNSGVNLLLGNSPHARADSGVGTDIDRYLQEADRRDMDERERDAYFRAQALDWMQSHPSSAARLYVEKVLNTFTIRQKLATTSEQQSPSQTLLLGITYLPLLALFLARTVIAIWRPLRSGEGLLLATYWVNALAAAVFFTRIRFRVPLDAVMIVSVCVWLAAWVHAVVDRRVDDTTSLVGSDDGPAPGLAS